MCTCIYTHAYNIHWFDVRIKRTNRVHRPKFRTHRRNTSKVAKIIAHARTCISSMHMLSHVAYRTK